MYPFVPAGTNPTVAEILAAIKGMLDTESAGSGLWMASHYDAVNGWVEIRRKGTQTGTLGTFRALLYGGTSPNAAAGAYAVTNNATTLYAGIAQSANTTGPDADYDTASPYSAGKRWTGGSYVVPVANIAKARTPYVSMIDCNEACAIIIGDSSYTSASIFGALIEFPDGNTSGWVCFNTGSTGPLSTYLDWGASAGYLGTPGQSSTGTSPAGLYHDGVNRKFVGRTWTGHIANDAYWKNPDGFFIPQPLTQRIAEPGSYATEYIGVARQLKLGPLQINRLGIRDGDSILQAYTLCPGLNVQGGPLYFDNFK